MVSPVDIARFGYGSGISDVGGVATPFLMGGVGASDPVGAYMQSAPVSGISGTGTGAFPSAPTLSGNAVFSNLMGIGSRNGNGVGGGGLFGGMSGWDAGKLILGGLQTIGSLWQAYEANKLAKKQFEFTKDFAMKNMANQIQNYNTTLEDRINSRYFTEGKTPEQAKSYIEDHKLPPAS